LKVALDDAIEVVVARLSAGRDDVGLATESLSDGERQRASRFAFERGRRRFIVGRARLRHLLGARLGVPPQAVEFECGAHGKPALARRFADAHLRFNLSHSDELAVYAFSRGGEIGIDVEAIRPLADPAAIAAHFFSRREHAAYRALDPRDRPLGFFQCWTRKEAFIKALGDGLTHPLDSFDVSLAPGEPAELLHIETPREGDYRGWRMESFFPAPGFIAAVVAEELLAASWTH
jgi:4'-phosphopantetheinyl transferase